MNVVIEDFVNKKFHPYMFCTSGEQSFVMDCVNKINKKNGTNLIVHLGVDLNEFRDKKFEMDQGLLDKLILNYNSNLSADEKMLDLWTRD